MRLQLALLGLLALGTDRLAAQPAPIDSLAAKFGALETVDQISLAPDGSKIAYLGQLGADQVIFVADMVAGGVPKPIIKAESRDARFSWCGWSTPQRLVCDVRTVLSSDGVLLGFSSLVALDADGKRLVKLTRDQSSRALRVSQDGGTVLDWSVPGEPGKVLMTHDYVPESAMGTNLRKDQDGLGVDMVDTVTLKRSKVESPRRGAAEYLTDGRGNVRIMGLQESTSLGYAKDTISYLYRRQGSRDWEPLVKLNLAPDAPGSFTPVTIDADTNTVVGFDYDQGMIGLYSMALDGSKQQKKLLGRSDVDIDSVVTIGRQRKVVGASYATERRTIEYFDPALAALGRALTKALPGKPNVDIIDSDDSGTKLIVLAWSDTNPGMFYLLDRTTNKLEELLPVRQDLAQVPLAPMKPVTYKAADGTVIPAYLTLPLGSSGKGLPTIVMPHGGPGSRDEWGFDWLVQYYAARGYAVLQPNFRGSAGYGSAWYQQNGFKSWRVAVGDVNDAGRWLISQGIAAPDKLAVLGWSYGGYAALQSPVLDPNLFKAIVAIAPVTDLERLRKEAEPYSNFPLVNAFIGTGPHVRQGSPAQNAAAIKAPVLLFHGTMDQNVGVGESRMMADKLRGAGGTVTYVEFPGLGHQLNDSAARTRLLSESDAFLRKVFAM